MQARQQGLVFLCIIPFVFLSCLHVHARLSCVPCMCFHVVEVGSVKRYQLDFEAINRILLLLCGACNIINCSVSCYSRESIFPPLSTVLRSSLAASADAWRRNDMANKKGQQGANGV